MFWEPVTGPRGVSSSVLAMSGGSSGGSWLNGTKAFTLRRRRAKAGLSRTCLVSNSFPLPTNRYLQNFLSSLPYPTSYSHLHTLLSPPLFSFSYPYPFSIPFPLLINFHLRYITVLTIFQARFPYEYPSPAAI